MWRALSARPYVASNIKYGRAGATAGLTLKTPPTDDEARGVLENEHSTDDLFRRTESARLHEALLSP